MKKFDALIIGGGPGGYRSAQLLAAQGKKVALFERNRLGGSCLHVGCIPTKLLQSAAVRYHSIAKEGKAWGIEADQVRFNFGTIAERIQRTVTILERGIQSTLTGVEVIQGEAEVKAKDLVACAGGEYSAPALLLATGSRPKTLPSFPLGEKVVTSDELLSKPRLPNSLLIVGAGVIGLEFACLFAQLGVKVRVGDILPQVLPNLDEELGQVLLNSVRRLGVEVELGLPEVKSKGEEMVLVAVGRSPNSDRAGIPSLGLRTSHGRIETDGHLQTSVKGVYALGDLTGNHPYAHTAYEHARIAAGHVKEGEGAETLDDAKVPHVVFTTPEIASVGLTESQARARYPGTKVLKNNFAANSKARILGEIGGWAKLVVEGGSGRILGVHLTGPEATDLIGEACLLVSQGMTLGNLRKTLHPHPTLSEIFEIH